MTHEDLRDKLLKAMGGKPPISARSSWAEFIKTRGDSFFLKYDWVSPYILVHFFKWLMEDPSVDFGDAPDGMNVFIYEFGRVGHDK